MSKRAFNFCAGPAALPTAVLQRAQAEMLDWQGKGLSVMEMSHRSDEYVAIASQAEQDLRDLLAVPNDYKVLFLQGGASQQFAEIPLNLLPEDGVADYVETGIWSKKAIEEARRYGAINVAASAKAHDYFAIPGQNDWQLSKDAAYVHYCSNETIGGLQFDWVPQVGDTPLVADMSSDILSRHAQPSPLAPLPRGEGNRSAAAITSKLYPLALCPPQYPPLKPAQRQENGFYQHATKPEACALLLPSPSGRGAGGEGAFSDQRQSAR